MPFIYVDRRKAGRGKSTPNRQKLMKRIRSFIKQSSPTTIGSSTVAGSNTPSYSNPVRVAGNALEEPRFAYAKGGVNTMVVNGNPKYNRGDEIDMAGEEQGRGKGQGGPGDSGEDDFIVNIAGDEFLDLFFEDCELPNLTNEKVTEKLDNKRSHAGFSTQGNPAQLSIIRTYKQSLGRRKALTGPYRQEKEEVETRMKLILECVADNPKPETEKLLHEEFDKLEARLIELNRKIGHIAAFDKVDLRYRKHEHKPLMTVQAVLFMVMDISGSMDQEKKTIARRWFALLYAFIKRRYSTCDLVFVAHTEEALEMSENDFFSTRINGGTMVSPALKMVCDIINDRYDPTQTNIYVSHASDGDNWDSDTDATVEQMDHVMAKVQHFSYVEVGVPWGYGMYGAPASATSDTVLWNAYEQVQDSVSIDRISMSQIQTPDKCYEVFKKIFRK
jgi:hypothetical protein